MEKGRLVKLVVAGGAVALLLAFVLANMAPAQTVPNQPTTTKLYDGTYTAKGGLTDLTPAIDVSHVRQIRVVVTTSTNCSETRTGNAPPCRGLLVYVATNTPSNGAYINLDRFPVRQDPALRSGGRGNGFNSATYDVPGSSIKILGFADAYYTGQVVVFGTA
jgi:hypothetical protein